MGSAIVLCVAVPVADHVADHRRRDSDLALGRRRDVGVVVVGEPGDIRRSAPNGGAEALISRPTVCGSPPAFEEPFPKMDEMALRAQLARPPDVGRRDARLGEQIAPATSTWWATMSPYSSGKTSSVRRNSSRSRTSGTASRAPPVVGQGCALGQVVEREPLHQRDRVRQLRGGDGRVQAVRADRLQAGTEDAAEIRGERVERGASSTDSETASMVFIIAS